MTALPTELVGEFIDTIAMLAAHGVTPDKD